MKVSLSELLKEISVLEVIGNTDVEISGLILDSRKAAQGLLFAAIKGTQVDGHSYIQAVVEKNIAAVLCEVIPETVYSNIVYIKVANSSEALGKLAAAFYHHPSEKLKLIAVTGTNGKTTVATLLFQLFRKLGHTCGLLSTVQNQIEDTIIPATHTTPDAVSLQHLLSQMADAGCSYVFMEASSHAIHQERIKGCRFEGVIFTNLTHDHLDYHHTFDEYLKAKKKLFDEVNADAWALTNKDDRNGKVMLQNCEAVKYTYALQTMADFKAKIMECDFNGLLLNIENEEVWFKLVGKFNAYNLLAVYGAAFLCGKTKEEILPALSSLSSVTGRFDYINSKTNIAGIVDYAHTPDALKNVLQTIGDIRTRNEKLITVVGCGGNRDTAKRPIMATVAAEFSEKIILTSDNPRNEDPESILDQMEAGVPALHYKKTLRISDRKEAIKAAVSMAEPGDIILVAGKGHETYQEIKGVKYEFDDKKILAETFKLFDK